MKRIVHHWANILLESATGLDFSRQAGSMKAAVVRTTIAHVLAVSICIGGCSPSPNRDSSATRELDPQTRTLIEAAQTALENREYLRGLSLVDGAINDGDEQPEVQFLRGRLLYEMGRTDEAVTAFETVLSVAPNFPGVQHNLGNIAFEQSRFRDAVTHFSGEATDHPAARPWHGAGGAYWSLGLADSARWAYEKSVTVDERYAPGFASLADWYESDGEFEKALDYARQALSLAPESAQYLYSVGALQVRLGNYSEGIEALSRVVQLEPWNHSAELGISQAYRGIGDDEQAGKHARQANALREAQMLVDRARRGAKRQPDSFQAQLEYANVLQQSKRLEEAIAQFEVARTLRPDNLGLRNNIATLYLQIGREQEALERYQAIINDDSTYAEAWLNLALFFGRQGETAQADRALKRAVQFGKDNPRVRDVVARLRNAPR